MLAGDWLNPASLLSLGRLALTPLICSRILDRDFSTALALFAIAGISDALDGYLARRFGWTSRTGAYLDPVADKVLLTAVYLCLAVAGAAPWWLVGLIIARDVMILIAACTFLLLYRERNFPPSNAGKVSTILQICAAVVVLMGGANQVIFLTVAAATLISGAGYMWRGARMARRRGAVSD